MGNVTGDCHRWGLGARVNFAQVKISKLPPVQSGRADGRKNCARMAAEENKKTPALLSAGVKSFSAMAITNCARERRCKRRTASRPTSHSQPPPQTKGPSRHRRWYLRCPRKRMVHEIPCATVKIFIELREEGLLYKIPTFVGISRFQIGHGLGYSLHEARADLLIALKPFGCRVERDIEERVDFLDLADLRHDQKDSAGRLLRPFEAGARNDRAI